MKESIDTAAMFIEFKLLGKEALSMNHYELAKVSKSFDASQWASFLKMPQVQDYIDSEMNIIRNSQMNKLIQQSGDSRSVGQAQLLSALQKLEDTTERKEGPVFIYCYVPLNEEQEHAPNIRKVDKDGQPIT